MANKLVRIDYTPVTGASNAISVTYDNAISGLLATNVQDAIDELDVNIDAEIARAGAAEVVLQDNIDNEAATRSFADTTLQTNIDTEATTRATADTTLQTNITTVQTNLDNHTTDAVDAHDATAISNVPAGNLAATEVQAALNELQTDVDTRALGTDLTTEISRATTAEALVQTNLDNHISDATDAHDASSISSVPAGNLAATDVQTALDELQTDVDTRALDSALTTEASTRATADTTLQTNIDTVTTDLADHIADTIDSHDATSISYDETVINRLTSTEVQAAIDELAARPAPADEDIELTSFNLVASQTDANVTGFIFDPALVRGFDALVTIKVDALYEQVKVSGIYTGADFVISLVSTGQTTGVTLDITALGQVTYSSPALTSGKLEFRAIITHI